jgi:cytochrome c oxidase cbb3-type subunit IV
MDVDLNLIRSAVTLLSLLLFAGIWAWAWGRARRERFEEAARLPLIGD